MKWRRYGEWIRFKRFNSSILRYITDKNPAPPRASSDFGQPAPAGRVFLFLLAFWGLFRLLGRWVPFGASLAPPFDTSWHIKPRLLLVLYAFIGYFSGGGHIKNLFLVRFICLFSRFFFRKAYKIDSLRLAYMPFTIALGQKRHIIWPLFRFLYDMHLRKGVF